MTRRKRCCKCGQQFAAEIKLVSCPGGRRLVSQRVCPDCTKARHRWVNRQARAQERAARPAAATKSTGISAQEQVAREYGRSREEIARTLGITEAMVRQGERTLLRKLRTNRRLSEAYAAFNDDGCPSLVQLIRELRPKQKEINLLQLQAELIEWWEVLTKARAAGLTDADGLGEALAGLAKCQALLAEKIGNR